MNDLAHALADLGAALPGGHITAWSATLAAFRRPSPHVEAALIDTLPGYGSAAPARRLVDAWLRFAPDLPGEAIALALRSAAETHHRAAARRTELVISGPTSMSVPVRLTGSVITEIIRSARKTLLIVSFAAYGVPDVIEELLAAIDRGVRLDLVLEAAFDDGGTLHGSVGASAAFEDLRHRATFWRWPANRRPVVGNSRAALHAKLIAADHHTALISSANLTDKALSRNLEVGTIVRDPATVRRLVQHFQALMNPLTGPLESGK